VEYFFIEEVTAICFGFLNGFSSLGVLLITRFFDGVKVGEAESLFAGKNSSNIIPTELC